MGSLNDLQVAALSRTCKRPREDDQPLLQRPCPGLSSQLHSASQFRFLEELCEFENSVDANAIDPEELVTEMMKSLEKIIGTMEEDSSLPQSSTSSKEAYLFVEAEEQHRPCKVEDDFMAGARHLVEVSDDLLGLPCPDVPEQGCSDLEDAFFQSSAGLCLQVPGGWSFDQLIESMPDFTRDVCDLRNLDHDL